MPFILYDVARINGQEQYNYVRELKLDKGSGPIAKHVSLKNTNQKVPFEWHASAEDLIVLSGGSPMQQAIVIDLKPSVPGNVSLYHLLDVWGFSYSDWTPLALCLRPLFVDHIDPNPIKFKRSFLYKGTKFSLVGEFLYMQGGVSSGTWNWGKVGRVNGALLWHDAFKYLSRSLDEILTECST